MLLVASVEPAGGRDLAAGLRVRNLGGALRIVGKPSTAAVRLRQHYEFVMRAKLPHRPALR